MLVLSRKVGEKIRIGGDIELTVVEIRGEAVRLGILAPRGISVYRQELLDAIWAENKEAATSILGKVEIKGQSRLGREQNNSDS